MNSYIVVLNDCQKIQIDEIDGIRWNEQEIKFYKDNIIVACFNPNNIAGWYQIMPELMA